MTGSSRLLKNHILSLGLASLRLGAAGVGITLALTGKGWVWVGLKGRQSQGRCAFAKSFNPPTSPPHSGLGGLAWGITERARPVPV